MIVALMTGTLAFADKSFEINKENCNLPMKEIRRLVPDEAQQKIIYRQCAKKASQERWTQKTLVSK